MFDGQPFFPRFDLEAREPGAPARRSGYLVRLVDRYLAYHEIARQRRAPAQLDRRLLDDIGVTPEAARRESSKPFWR